MEVGPFTVIADTLWLIDDGKVFKAYFPFLLNYA